MFILDQGGTRKRRVCWGCGKIHGPAKCPKVEAVDWDAVRRSGEQFWERAQQLRRPQRVG